ncbi:MAG TPA: magnesium transporter CorA family protein [Actinomycetaceae bacterium]|nr:magnesium transporter CorA family protein [Actinomycetaceae bacterium]
MTSTTTSRSWRGGVLTDEHVDHDELLAALKDPQSLVWFDLLEPDHKVLEALLLDLGLPPTAIEDAIAPRERSKLTRHESFALLTVYAAGDSESLRSAAAPDSATAPSIAVSRVTAIALPHALVTVRLDDGFHMDDVVERWEEGPAALQSSVAGLLHGLLDAVVDGHLDALENLEGQIDKLETDLLAERNASFDIARRIHESRGDIAALRRVILPIREVVSGLYRHGMVDDALRPWFDDVYDHILRAAEWSDTQRDFVSSLFETHLALQDARLNTITKKLAGWAAIIAVPTAITGWFGQNVPYPGFGQPLGVWLSIGFIVTTAGVLFAVFRKLDWL